MMKRKEIFFPSSDGRSRIFSVRWIPEQKPVGLVQIAHGMGEHSMRYERFAKFLTERGYLVFANDHIGHGRSVGEEGTAMYLGEEQGWKHVADDMRKLQIMTRKEYPGLPCYLIGFSMGSFLTRTFLIRFPGTVDAAVIIGTGWQSRRMLGPGRLLMKYIAKLAGPDKVKPAIAKLSFGAYNKYLMSNKGLFSFEMI